MAVLRRLAGYVRPYLGRIAAAAVMLTVSGALMGAAVATVKPLVNDVLLGATDAEHAVTGGAGPDILETVRDWLPRAKIARWTREHALVEVPLLLLLILIVRSILGYFGQYFLIRSGSCLIQDVRLDLYQAITYQSPTFFREHATGVIVSRILHDVGMIRRVATISMANGVRVAGMAPFIFAGRQLVPSQ